MEVEEAPEGMESFSLPEEDLQDRGDSDGHSTGLEHAPSPTERDQVAGGGGAGGGWVGADRAPSSRGGGGGPGGRARGPGSAGAAPSPPRLSCSLCERLFSSPEHLREHEYRHALSLMAVSPDWPDTRGAPPGPPGHQLPATLPQRPPLLLLHHHHHLLHRRRQRHHLQALGLPAAVPPASARYFCAQCPASFTLKSNADRHQKTIHLKRKLMQCAFCLKHFRDRTDLHRHLSSVHSKERGHACPACTKAFSTHKNLATHVKLCCQDPVWSRAGTEETREGGREPGWY